MQIDPTKSPIKVDAKFDLNSFTKFGIKIIDTIKDAAGVLYEPTRIKNKAKAEAQALVYKRAGEIIAKNLNEQAIVRLINKENKRQININNIVQKSIEFSNKEAENISDEKPTEDWIYDFFEQCQDITEEQVQIIWSKLLANEVKKPGSISRKTLHVLKTMTEKDVQSFNKFCRNVVEIEDDNIYHYCLIIENYDNYGYYDGNWDIAGSDLRLLQNIPLIYDSAITLEKKFDYNFKIGQENFKIVPKKEINLSYQALTDSGIELYKILTFDPNKKYFAALKEHLKSLKLITT